MPEIEGYTTAGVDNLIAGAVVSGAIDGGTGALTLTTHDGSVINVGSIGSGAPDATTSVKGIVELATDTETGTGTDSVRAVTPFGLKAVTTLLAPKDSPALTGTPTAPTQTAGNNSTRLATTAFVAAAVAAGGSGSGVFVNVKASGAVKGDGTTDDTTALNTVLNAAPVGSTVFFPAGIYLISAPIVYKSGVNYLGGGVAMTGAGATIKLKNGVNLTNAAGLTGMFVPDVWSSNATLSGAPVIIENLAFDGNKDNNTTSTACGVILMNYWSRLQDLYIFDTPKHGIELTDTTVNGTNVITNSASENRIVACKITSPNGNGINQTNNNEGANLDGFIQGCTLVDTVGAGIQFERSPGWLVESNHFYGIGTYAIEMGFAFATRVVDNYIEDFGNKNDASQWYWGIGVNVLGDRGAHVTGNIISCAEPNAVTSTTYYYIRVNAASGETTCRAVVANNLLFGANRVSGYGIVVEGTGTITAIIASNDVSNISVPYSISGTPTLEYSDIAPLGVPTVAIGAQGAGTPTLAAGSNNRYGTITVTSKASSLASGPLVTLTYSKPYAIAPLAIILSPINGNAGGANLCANSSASTFTVTAGAALAASTVYQFSYLLMF
jgi:hypothetical protein